MPPGPTGNAWKSTASGRACPAAAIPMTTPLRRTSSAASSVSWSTSSTILQGQLHRTMYLPTSKPFTTPFVFIPPLAGFRLQVSKLNLPLPPPNHHLPYLCVFIQLFPPVLCPFFGEGLTHPPPAFCPAFRALHLLPAAAVPCRLWLSLPLVLSGIFLFALALICVPSMKTTPGSTIRLFIALFRMCSKISSVSSGGNLL